MRALGALLAAAALSACVEEQYASAPAAARSDRIVIVMLSANSRYVIDPVARNCFFERSGSGLTQVPCESLVNDPAAAKILTWIPKAEPNK